MAVVFGLLGIMHFVFRKQFFAITKKFEDRNVDDIGIFNVWNFLFYVSIGLAIVLAVRIGGVIPVFAFLVVPPVAAILMTRSNAGVILIAMVLAVIGSFAGIQFLRCVRLSRGIFRRCNARSCLCWRLIGAPIQAKERGLRRLIRPTW